MNELSTPPPPTPRRSLLRHTLWRNLQTPGMEYAAFWQMESGFELAGHAVLMLESGPRHVHYHIGCNPWWETRWLDVRQEAGERVDELRLDVDERGRWWSEGAELAHLRDCLDVDLGVSPATNTLPVRRLNLEVGASREICAAWVRFPELAIETLVQRYTRLAPLRYRYESLRDGAPAFSAELEVDEQGVVVTYAGGWERV